MTKSFNAFHLKCLAILAMLINHIAHAFSLEQTAPVFYHFALFIGIWTFPIMAFFLVEGLYYTRNRWQYAGRLLGFAIVSIFPFHFAFPSHQSLNIVNNVFFTLFLGLVLLILCESIPRFLYHLPLVLVFSYLSTWSDWGPQGVVFIYALYLAHKHRITPTLPLLLFFAYMFYRYWQLYSLYPWAFTIFVPLSTTGILCLIPLLSRYNGQRGYNPLWVKWGFYLFYPLHLILLTAIRQLFFGG